MDTLGLRIDPVAHVCRPQREQSRHQRSGRGDSAIDGRFFHEGTDDAEMFFSFVALHNDADFAQQSYAVTKIIDGA